MDTPRTIFVTGATGNQGGAVARCLIDHGYHVKALTRSPVSREAQQLRGMGAEVIHGNLNEPKTFKDHLQNVDGLFSVQTFVTGIEKELAQGYQLIDLAKAYNIPHFLYSSVAGADQQTGIPHWDSKFKIENYLKASGLSFTIIRPVSLYENFLIPEVHKRLLKGKLVFPAAGTVVQQMVAAGDIGKISTLIFSDVQKYKDATITVATEQLDLLQVASIFSDVLGRKIEYQKLPMIITRLFMGRDLYKMFNWINVNNCVFVNDVNSFRKEYPGLMSLRDWIKLNFTTT
jgi:uncharacterized protein YbjT (DUF2867 family)